MVVITFPDGSKKNYPANVTALDVAKDISEGLARNVLAAKVNGQPIDAFRPLHEDAELQLLTSKDDEGLEVLRHSAAHLMAHAIKRLYPKALPTIGPVIENGFYYDFDNLKITEEDLGKIEAEMKKIIKEKHDVSRIDHPTKKEALETYKNNQYKVQLINEFDEGSSSYAQGDFQDLCRGPHVPNTGAFKQAGIKLDKIASAYWRGDAKQKQLTRIYGLCFAGKEELNNYLAMRQEAEKRDHRKLGKTLQLFVIDEHVGQGLILWTPNGAIIRQELQNFIAEQLRRQNYKQVFTPHIGKLDLYRTSGHFPYYQDSQYPPIISREQLEKLASEKCTCAELLNRLGEGAVEGYLLKPMNCPHHIKIFASQPRSYRDMPLRLAEFGTVYRWEQSGEISGMTRVRGFTQDDAHLFCRKDQVADELIGCLQLVKTIFQTLGIIEYRVRVGLRDPDAKKYVGDTSLWDAAEDACRRAAKTLNVPFSEEPGEAAFYGPKIDFVVKDVLGREWQLGTVQVDYNLPQRFGLSFANKEGSAETPVMIHRAPFGSMERFVGVLIEHFAGKFPLWLSPVQAKILPIADRHAPYAEEVAQQLRDADLRADVDARAETINKKVREAQLDKVNYILVVGDKEMTEGTVTVRTRDEKVHGAKKVPELVRQLVKEVKERKLPDY